VVDGPVVAVNTYFTNNSLESANAYAGYPAGDDYPQLFANALYAAAGFDASTACNGDYDDDGLSDEDESTLGTDFQRADSDADGTNDGIDNCPTVANPDQRDFDSDGIGDACADNPPPDSDGDGHPDPYDNCPDTANPDQADTDDNGTGDACEPLQDADDDGTADDVDNCPDTANPDQEDTDNNGIGDACEPEPEPAEDTDEDGVVDDDDNCPTIFNPNQEDEDDDGIGDICDDTPTIGCSATGTAPVWGLLMLLPFVATRRRRQT
jgi:uncharacterized protein (TIGR03382 family)